MSYYHYGLYSNSKLQNLRFCYSKTMTWRKNIYLCAHNFIKPFKTYWLDTMVDKITLN